MLPAAVAGGLRSLVGGTAVRDVRGVVTAARDASPPRGDTLRGATGGSRESVISANPVFKNVVRVMNNRRKMSALKRHQNVPSAPYSRSPQTASTSTKQQTQGGGSGAQKMTGTASQKEGAGRGRDGIICITAASTAALFLSQRIDGISAEATLLQVRGAAIPAAPPTGPQRLRQEHGEATGGRLPPTAPGLPAHGGLVLCRVVTQ